MPPTRDHSVATELIAVLEKEWTNHAFLDEPYSPKAAVEIALNELLDYARDHGLRVHEPHDDGVVHDLIVETQDHVKGRRTAHDDDA